MFFLFQVHDSDLLFWFVLASFFFLKFPWCSDSLQLNCVCYLSDSDFLFQVVACFSVTVFWGLLAFHDDAETYSWVILAVQDVGTYSFERTILKNIQRQVMSGHEIQSEVGPNIDLGPFVKSWVMVGHKVKSEAGIVKMATCWDLQIVLYFEHQVIKSYIVTRKDGMGT